MNDENKINTDKIHVWISDVTTKESVILCIQNHRRKLAVISMEHISAGLPLPH